MKMKSRFDSQLNAAVVYAGLEGECQVLGIGHVHVLCFHCNDDVIAVRPQSHSIGNRHNPTHNIHSAGRHKAENVLINKNRS